MSISYCHNVNQKPKIKDQQTNRPTDQSGQQTARDLLIVAAVILAAAALSMSAYLIWSKQKSPAPAVDNAYLEQIKKDLPSPPGSGRETVTNAQGASGAAGAAPQAEERSLTAVLTAWGGNKLTLTEKGTNNQTIVNLKPETIVTYNNEPFDRSRFYIGDQLEITVVKENDLWQARQVKVIVSANPATAAPVPKTPNIRPDGSIKPL